MSLERAISERNLRAKSADYDGSSTRHGVSSQRSPVMDTVNVIVEIPRFSQNKYEYDHENDTIKLDRHLLVAMGYPAEYGFIPDTLGGDGDPSTRS